MIDWLKMNDKNGWGFAPWPPLNEIHGGNGQSIRSAGKNRLVKVQKPTSPLPMEVRIIVVIISK